MNNIEYVNIMITTNNRYICESRDSRNRRITVIAESTDTIEDIMNKLEEELDPFERELNTLREEQSVMKEREAELTKNVAELAQEKADAIQEATKAKEVLDDAKNVIEDLANKYAEKTKDILEWTKAVEAQTLLKVGDLVKFTDDRVYMVIFEHTASADRPPYGTWTWFTDVTQSINEDIADEVGTVPVIIGPDTLHLYPAGYVGQQNGFVYKSKYDNNGNPVMDNGWWENLGPIEEYQGLKNTKDRR